MDASVVIALNPHENDFERVLEGYLHQTVPPSSFEIIVVNGGARSDVQAKLDRASRIMPVRLIEIGGHGRATANNAGVRAAQSNLIVFTADDFVPCTTLVRAHIDFHRQASARAVGIGPAFFADELREDPFRRWLEDSGLLFGIAFGMAGSDWPQGFFYVGNASMHRSLFEELGRFDEAFDHDLTDDFEFSLRLRRQGVRTHFLPKARCSHEHDVTLGERMEASRRCGEARLGAAWPHRAMGGALRAAPGPGRSRNPARGRGRGAGLDRGDARGQVPVAAEPCVCARLSRCRGAADRGP